MSTTHAAAPAVQQKQTRFAGELAGGVASAIVDLALLLTYGVLVFGALGTDHAVRVAFAGAIFGGATATMFGGTPVPGSGPRAATSLILATFVAALASDSALRTGGAPDAPAIFFLAAACVVLGGLIQIGFGLARLGSLVKFVPYPALAGFMNGVAILIVLSQLPPLLGTAGPWTGGGLLDALATAQPWTTIVGVTTAALVWILAARWPRLPAAVIGVAVGAVLYHLIAAWLPEARLGDLLTSVSGALPLPVALAPLFAADFTGAHLLAAHGKAVVATAFVLATIGSLDSLLAATASDVAHGTHHRPNRELLGQGLGNVVSGLFGGLPIAYSAARANPAFRAGARTRLSGLIAAMALLAVFLIGGKVLGYVPVAALAGLMLVVAVGLVDSWSSGLARSLARGRAGRETRWSLAVVVLVCVVTVVSNFVVAVLVGVLASMALFIAAMNRSLVRASWNGLQRTSRRVYPLERARRLQALRGSIRILELEGALFFGTAERLRAEVERVAADARFVILDFRRVGTVDATGAVVLEQLSVRLAARGVSLLLAHVTPEVRLGRALTDHGAFSTSSDRSWFEDLDRALEFAEGAVLSGPDDAHAGSEIPLERTSLLSGLEPQALERVKEHLERRELASGETVFREGERGDQLYVLTRGTVSILTGAAGGAQRIVTMEPGVFFGEMAMLDGAARSATAIADEPVVLYSLSATEFERICATDAVIGSLLLTNIARHLSGRLRLMTDALRAESGAESQPD